MLWSMQVLASDELTPGTALTEVLSMHFDEASSVLSLIHDPANLQKRKKLKDRLAALQAAKGLLPA